MLVEAIITINASPATVWQIISNIKGAAEIISGIEKAEIRNEPTNGLVGLKWTETRLYFGKPTAIDKWITHAEAEQFYTTKAEMDGFEFITTLTISKQAEGVRLSSSHETTAKGFVAKLKSLPMVFFRGVLKKAILQDLQDYKAAAEKI